VAIGNFQVPHYRKIYGSLQSEAKEKASLENFTFFFGIRQIIPSKSRSSFEALP
jgi:hypothetical protein